MTKHKFTLPIHVVCFNRPDCLEQLLASLQSQTRRITEARLFFWLDGYSGSKDEFLGRPDRTVQLKRLISKFFSGAKVSASEKNLGIARNFDRAEKHSLAKREDAVFFEEDMLLAPDYLTALLDIDRLVGNDPRIATISAHGIDLIQSTEPRSSSLATLHNPWPLALTHRTWGFLLRHAHALERRPLIDAYFECLGKKPYWQRDPVVIRRRLARHGLIVRGGAQDEVKAEIARKLGRMQVCGVRRLAATTGEQGEHFISLDRQSRPELFDTKLEAWHPPERVGHEVLGDMLAVYRRIYPHETLCTRPVAKRGFFGRTAPRSGGVLDICRVFNTYAAEENVEWGSFAWLKPMQVPYFPQGSQELVFHLPSGWAHKSRRGILFTWLTRGEELIIRRGMLRFGCWSVVFLPSFVPRRTDPKSEDGRRLAFPVQSFCYR